MTPNDDAEIPARLPVWLRLPIAMAAVAAIVWLAGRMPPLPVAPWAPIQPVRDQEIQTWLAFAAWTALVALCVAVAVTNLKPSRRAVSAPEPAQPAAIRPVHQSATAARTPPSTALLEIFASPRQTVGVEASTRHATALVGKIDAGDDTLASVRTVKTSEAGRPMLRLFGPLSVDRPPRIRLAHRWGEGLVAYLAVKGAAASVDEVIDALWPDQPRPSRQRIWKAKQQAQVVLGEALQADRDGYRLDLSLISRDIDEIEQLRKGVPTAEQLDRALALMDGEPLAGIAYPWADNERRRLHAIRTETLTQVTQARLSRDEPANALAAAEELLRLDALNEQAWQLAMQADAALGNRQAILDRYQHLTRELDERLGLKPSVTTRDLYHELLSQA